MPVSGRNVADLLSRKGNVGCKNSSFCRFREEGLVITKRSGGHTRLRGRVRWACVVARMSVSNAQDRRLKHVTQEYDKVKEDLEASNKIIKVSEACKTLVQHCTETDEPFNAEESRWKTGGGGKDSDCKCALC